MSSEKKEMRTRIWIVFFLLTLVNSKPNKTRDTNFISQSTITPIRAKTVPTIYLAAQETITNASLNSTTSSNSTNSTLESATSDEKLITTATRVESEMVKMQYINVTNASGIASSTKLGGVMTYTLPSGGNGNSAFIAYAFVAFIGFLLVVVGVLMRYYRRHMVNKKKYSPA